MKILDTSDGSGEILARILADGGVAIVPTDTVYGIICDASNEEAKEKVYKLKNRSKRKPLIGFIDTPGKVRLFASASPGQLEFAGGYWPGPSTFIFKSREAWPYITSEEGKIAFRIPRNNFLLQVLGYFKAVASTSANISGQADSASFADIGDELKEKVDLCIDGGQGSGRPSSIWDITGEEPVMARGSVLFASCGDGQVSLFAAEVLKRILAGEQSGVSVMSTGLGMVSPEILERADIIFVMEGKDKRQVLAMCPGLKAEVVILDIRSATAGAALNDLIEDSVRSNVLRRLKMQ